MDALILVTGIVAVALLAGGIFYVAELALRGLGSLFGPRE